MRMSVIVLFVVMVSLRSDLLCWVVMVLKVKLVVFVLV